MYGHKCGTGLEDPCVFYVPSSASAMFVTHGIPSFYELLRKCIYNFSERISRSKNFIIKAFLSPILCIFNIRHWWRTVLFYSSQLDLYLIPMKEIIYYLLFL